MKPGLFIVGILLINLTIIGFHYMMQCMPTILVQPCNPISPLLLIILPFVGAGGGVLMLKGLLSKK